ncbi:MAG: amidohydrolase [Bacteroidetes bacterium]|nr:amidohydrolase [Bacteroidota bacterium]
MSYLKFVISLCFFTSIFFNSYSQNNMEQTVREDYPYLFDLYKYLHANPELSFYETNTSQRMAKEMRSLGFEVTEQFGGNGVVAVLKNGNGPTVLVRADMDALPVEEETGLPYASKVETVDEEGNTVSVMHACGHDVHMSVWIGTARALAKLKSAWSGTIIFIGQPAEERSGGAKAMLKEGLFEKYPRPDYALALHVSPALEAGKVGYCPEYAMANVDMVTITVYGQGGHGAYPHTTKDPVVLAAKIVLDLQTIVSREISPLEPAVVTVGSIHGGAKGNVIPDEVKMELTLRSYSDEVRNAIIEKLKRTCAGTALSAGFPEDMLPKVEVRNEYTPSLYNDPALTERIAKAFKQAIGEKNVLQVPPVMAGEDFGRYGRVEPKVPICLYWLGTVDAKKVQAAQKGEISLPPLHSSKFAPEPEKSIKTGVLTMTGAVLDLLKK